MMTSVAGMTQFAPECYFRIFANKSQVKFVGNPKPRRKAAGRRSFEENEYFDNERFDNECPKEE